MKVHLAIPSLDMVPVQFALSLAAMMQTIAQDRRTRKDIAVSIGHQQGSLIMDARNTLVAQAQSVGASHIMFLDSDMTFPPSTLSVLASHHKPIVAASYVKRYPPHPILGIPFGPYNPSILPLAEMLTVPLGCSLIKLSVFDSLSRPYFEYIKRERAEDDISEDTFFCNSARIAGFKILVDVELTKSIGHVGTKVYTAKDTQS